MNNKGQLIQDPFLNEIRKEKIPVSIYLVNGIKLQGLIESFDQFVVLWSRVNEGSSYRRLRLKTCFSRL